MKIKTIKNPFPKFKNTSPKSGEELRILAEQVAKSLREQAEYLRKERENVSDYYSLFT
ncbi:MAG: hypothetical protein ABIJ33_04900 [Patescibacteria group bacterium]|nr:hypothetical protein [Patescibacteria group bacterium]